MPRVKPNPRRMLILRRVIWLSRDMPTLNGGAVVGMVVDIALTPRMELLRSPEQQIRLGVDGSTPSLLRVESTFSSGLEVKTASSR